MRAFRSLLLLILLYLGGATPLLAQNAPEAEPARPYRVAGLERDDRRYDALVTTAHRAWRQLEEASGGKSWTGYALVVWCDSERDFLARTGKRPEHIIAAASPSQMTVWINPSAWNRASYQDRLQTLTHEFGHLLLGQLPGGRGLPLWANEGLVMHLAGQWNTLDAVRMAEARFFGKLPRLEQLEDSFPDTGQVDLAYAMSWFAVDSVARHYGDKPGHVERLCAVLADPLRGPRLAEELRDPLRRDGVELSVYHQLGDSATSTAIVFFSGSVFWLVVVALVFAAWWRKRRRAEEIRRREEEEEGWAASLTEADIQDIYGDREDRWESHDDDRTRTAPSRKNPWPAAEDR